MIWSVKDERIIRAYGFRFSRKAGYSARVKYDILIDEMKESLKDRLGFI